MVYKSICRSIQIERRSIDSYRFLSYGDAEKELKMQVGIAILPNRSLIPFSRSYDEAKRLDDAGNEQSINIIHKIINELREDEMNIIM